MEAIFNQIIELIKYRIVNSINTGDKVYDNLLVALTVGILIYLTSLLKDHSKEFYLYFLIKIWNKENYKVINGMIKHPELIERPDVIKNPFGWSIYFGKCEPVETICKWIVEHYPKASYGGSRILTINKLSTTVLKTYDAKIWRCFNYFPFFQIGKDIIFAHSTSDDTFVLHFNHMETLDEFFKLLPGISLDDIKGSTKSNSSLDIINPLEKDSFVTNINPKRTFETLVFKQKNMLLQRFETFKKNNLSSNVFCSKNSGILLYGEWGTGKTSVIRATCNYFGRSGAIFNFKQQRKAKAFISAVNRVHKSHILIFDELDFLLKSLKVSSEGHSLETEENNTNSNTKSSTNKAETQIALQLTRLQNQIEMCKDENLAKELKQNYLKNISAGDDPDLDMATFLTILDGLYDHENRIIIATTNNPEYIPSSLLRSGRFDLKLYLGRYEQEQYIELLSKIFAEEIEEKEELKEWLSQQNFPSNRWAPADIITVAQDCGSLKSTVEYLLKEKPIFKVKIPDHAQQEETEKDSRSSSTTSHDSPLSSFSELSSTP